MAKLWEKDYSTDKLIEEFTVGRDYRLDMNLIPSDCIASIAHARMLNSINILSDSDFNELKTELMHIIHDHKEGKFHINQSDEDGHTAIENRLSEVCGDSGKRIHTGRSRNDQVVTCVRVFSRSMLLEILEAGLTLTDSLLVFAEKYKDIPMVGRTHMQTAMPSTVGLWAGAFAEELADDMTMVFNTLQIINQNPLGAAAGYGVPLPLNREMSAELMGFPKVQNNVIYVNNSRGKFESIILDSLDQIGLTLSKMAQDLILFSLPEFGYFKLPDELCTGSSIMPQKKNPDGLELTRSASAVISAASTEVKNIIRSLPSGYNRDFQSAKEPFIRGNRMALTILKVMDLTITKLQVNEDRLVAGFTPDIYATDAALEMVAAGSTFREAYKEVGLNLNKLTDRDPYEAVKSRTHSGSTGNPRFEICREAIDQLKSRIEKISTAVNSAVSELTGEDVQIILPEDYR
jgi:argininosuccinate lyase